jgi:hypothetical protein
MMMTPIKVFVSCKLLQRKKSGTRKSWTGTALPTNR